MTLLIAADTAEAWIPSGLTAADWIWAGAILAAVAEADGVKGALDEAGIGIPLRQRDPHLANPREPPSDHEEPTRKDQPVGS
ncbi:MAG: hypothetical protein ACR2HV_04335, partial [Acidimicrobiales bacterium]